MPRLKGSPHFGHEVVEVALQDSGARLTLKIRGEVGQWGKRGRALSAGRATDMLHKWKEGQSWRKSKRLRFL